MNATLLAALRRFARRYGYSMRWLRADTAMQRRALAEYRRTRRAR